MSIIIERIIPISLKVVTRGLRFEQELDVLHVNNDTELPKVRKLIKNGVLDRPLDVANDFDGTHRISWRDRETTALNADILRDHGLKSK